MLITLLPMQVKRQPVLTQIRLQGTPFDQEVSKTFLQTTKADGLCCDWRFKGYYCKRPTDMVRIQNKLNSSISIYHSITLSLGFGVQLIGPIQLYVKRHFFSACESQDLHSPFKKVKRQPTLIISFSQHSPFFEGQTKNQAEIRSASKLPGEFPGESVTK